MSGDSNRQQRPGSDRGFYLAFATLTGGYALLLAAMLAALVTYTTPATIAEALTRPAIQRSIVLTLVSSTAATAAAIAIGTPLACVMSCYRFRGRALVDALLDLPNVLPPLVLGLCLLILFQTPPLRPLAPAVVYQLPAVFLAQFVVAIAAAVPVLRAAFDQTSPRHEQVALTLGCSRWQAFRRVTLPAIRPGVLTAAALAWAKCFGCFGPLLVFAGATRNKTEVLATTIYLELSAGQIESAVAVSLMMVAVATAVLSIVRWVGATPRRRTQEAPR